MEQTRIQAFKELRSLLSEVLASAVADEEVPDAFKNAVNWEKLIAQTETRLAEGWRQRFDGKPQQRANLPMLDLLPDDEHGQQVLTERFVNDVSYQDRSALDDLDRQLAALSGDEHVERRGNPLAPTAWAEGIRGGMKLMNCTPEERDWLMERLIPLLTARMGMFYSGLTNRLSSAGYHGRASDRGRGFATGQGGQGNAYSPELVPTQGQTMFGGGDHGGDGMGGVEIGGGEAGMMDEGAAALDALFGMLSARRGPAMGGGAGGFAGQGGSAGAGAYFGGGGGPGHGGGGGGGGGYAAAPSGMQSGPVTPWSQADIFSILSLMQGSYGAGGSASPSMGQLQQAMSATASQLGLAGGMQAMPAPAQDMLELVSMLFEALLDGRRLDKKARSQLARLIIPYVRVAMLDRRLFMQSLHPARRVLNLLVEAFETAAPDVPHFSSLRELGFKTIDTIVEEFAEDLKLFEMLEKTLSSELDACRRRAEVAERRAADAQNGQERKQVARDAVAGFLGTAIAGRHLPKALLDFLAGPWQHHQNIVFLREGEKGDNVLSGQGLLRNLLDCSEHGSIDDAGALRHRLVDVMLSSGQLSSAADELLAELSIAFATAPPPVKPEVPEFDANWQPKAAEPTQAEAASAILAADEAAAAIAMGSLISQYAEAQQSPPMAVASDVYVVEAVAVAELPADIVARYVHMPIGAWLDFIAEDGRVTSARISWTSPISGRRILSNRRGQRMLVASPEELAAMEIEGRIRPRHSESAFDQALHAVTSRLQASSDSAVAGAGATSG